MPKVSFEEVRIKLPHALRNKFITEYKTVYYLRKALYPGKVHCHNCSSNRVTRRKEVLTKYDCLVCRSSFSILRNTIFEKSSTDLIKWIYVINLTSSKNAIVSTEEIKKQIGVTSKTVLRMLDQIKQFKSSGRGNNLLKELLKSKEKKQPIIPKEKVKPHRFTKRFYIDERNEKGFSNI